MTALPLPGGYPDPEAAGRQWRWWDGVRWAPPGYGYAPAFDPVAHAHALARQAQSTSSTGQWLRWAMAANAVSSVVVLAGTVVAFRSVRSDWFTTDTDGTLHMSRTFTAFQLLSLPLQLVPLAFLILLIAWVYNAGKFAELQRWPAMRNRTLGAFSILIPIVNLWWPYEAVRDAFPPDGRSPVLLEWWLSYLLIGMITYIPAVFTAMFAPVGVSVALVVLAAVLAPIPVVFGWRLVRDLDAVQRAASAG